MQLARCLDALRWLVVLLSSIKSKNWNAEDRAIIDVNSNMKQGLHKQSSHTSPDDV